jgi:phage shock protein PspC (stress-responsive transcriptional regulator)
MNKTVTINISGIIFHIEEDAYDKLSKYLSTIRGYFNRADGGNEIMSDIEARIAEMLQSKTSAIKQVVLMADVDYVMDSMGKPEEFAGDAQQDNSSQQTDYNYEEPIKKRLHRDGDSKVLGGVCSGIGHYFGFDPVWLRIALALMLFFAGTGILLYIILWIAIPEAKTTAEKLAMKGERADINNISKAVKEEAEQFKKRMEKYGKEFSNMANDRLAPRNTAEKIVDFVGDVFINVGRVLLKVLGVLMVIFGVIFFFGLFSSVFGMSFMTSNVEVKDWIDMVLLDGKDFYLGLIGVSIFFGTPIIMMIYGGIKILFKIRYSNRWLNLGAGVIWLIGFIITFYIGVKTSSDFAKEAKVRENMSLEQHDTLYLKLNALALNYDELYVNEDDDHIVVRKHHDDYMIGKHDGLKYLLGHAQLNIIKSQTNQVELVVVKEANGYEKKNAVERAKNISYSVVQKDSLLTFDNIFRVNNADKFRMQDVKVILKVPVGKVVYLDKSLEDFMYDIENVTNTYDGDMVNRRWIMTENGLKCLDCNGITNNNFKDDAEDEHDMVIHKDVQINVNGVDIQAKDAQIKMDSNGVKINSKETKLVIDKNGIHVNNKKDHQ